MGFSKDLLEYKGTKPSLSSLSTQTDLYFLETYGMNSKSLGPNLSVPVPGNVYTFSYMTKSEVSEKVPFIDRSPLVLYLNSERIDNQIILKCVDLSITPPDKRLEILMRFYDHFEKEIEENSDKIKNGITPSPVRISGSDVSGLFSGTGYNFSVTGFKWSYIENLRLVKPLDWCKLPFLKYTNIQGLDINKIYSLYREKQNG